jgi:UPF0716 protein FxsA
MNVAKYLLLAVLLLPFLELAAFIAVARAVGLLWALTLIVASSLAGATILRRAGGNHIARVRVAMGGGAFSALQADSNGAATLFGGILLLIPGFITDVLGLLLLIAPLRRALAALFGRNAAATHDDGVIDLDRDQWRQVPDQALPRGRNDKRGSQ